MSKGISKLQRRILELVAIPGEPTGLPREVLQAQLWPEVFGVDYRGTADSSMIVREKKKYRVILSRAIASLIRRGLAEESRQTYASLPAVEVSRRGLVLPYQLRLCGRNEPHHGNVSGRMVRATLNSSPPAETPIRPVDASNRR